jgi:hypothetical protein
MIQSIMAFEEEKKSEEYDSSNSSLRKVSRVFEFGKPGLGKRLELLFAFGHHIGALTSLGLPIDVLIDPQMVISERDWLPRWFV